MLPEIKKHCEYTGVPIISPGMAVTFLFIIKKFSQDIHNSKNVFTVINHVVTYKTIRISLWLWYV